VSISRTVASFLEHLESATSCITGMPPNDTDCGDSERVMCDVRVPLLASDLSREACFGASDFRCCSKAHLEASLVHFARPTERSCSMRDCVVSAENGHACAEAENSLDASTLWST
jgi:hypothetical protein